MFQDASFHTEFHTILSVLRMAESKRLDRVDVRDNLSPRRDPYWHRLSQGRYVGFRRMTKTSPGTWLARIWNPEKAPTKKRKQSGGYEYPDDLPDFSHLPLREQFDAAKVAAETWFQHLDRGGTTDVATVRRACKAYVDELRLTRSDAAADDALGRFMRLVDQDPLGRIRMNKLVPRHLAEWKKRVLERGGTRASFNRNITALRAALNLAHRRREVSSDLAWIEELLPLKNADRRRELYHDRTARKKMISKASPEIRPFLIALALLPMRAGELAQARVEHFSAFHRTLRVAGKTGDRIIPLGKDATAHFKACSADKLPAAWLVGRNDGNPWDRFAWRDQIRDAVLAAKLPKATCAYTLRHSVITDLVVGGLDLMTVARMSGTSIAMIDKHYGHLQQERARSALDGLSLV